MTEQQVQAKRIKQLEDQGYYVIKLMKTNKNGIPDLIALPRGSDVLFSEIKTKKGNLSPLQEYRLQEQKYIEDREAIVVSVDFLLKLELYPEEIATALLDSIYLMKRVVVDDISLGVAVNIDASSAVFFLVQFDMLTAYETRVRDFSLITSDQYLDLVLDKKVLK